jgi:glyoxylase-like metal-dependent hydrolase (beta-lactamase superfamily II)
MSDMQIQRFIFNSIRTCTYIVWDESCQCVFIDATCETHAEQQRITNFIDEHNLIPVAICNTHAHPDHVAGNAYLCNRYGISAYLHPDDNQWLGRAVSHGLSLGMHFDMPPATLALGAAVHFGNNSALEVLHTPGHSKGSVSYYSAMAGAVFTGDTLFAGCIGRTDLQDGNYDEIIHSIRTKLLTLPRETHIYAGHGFSTDIGTELLQNPFLSQLNI